MEGLTIRERDAFGRRGRGLFNGRLGCPGLPATRFGAEPPDPEDRGTPSLRLRRELLEGNGDEGRSPDRFRDLRPEEFEPAICAFISSAILNYTDVMPSPLRRYEAIQLYLASFFMISGNPENP